MVERVDLDELERVLKLATEDLSGAPVPLPWTRKSDGFGDIWLEAAGGELIGSADGLDHPEDWDALLAAVNALPSLISELRSARQMEDSSQSLPSRMAQEPPSPPPALGSLESALLSLRAIALNGWVGGYVHVPVMALKRVLAEFSDRAERIGEGKLRAEQSDPTPGEVEAVARAISLARLDNPERPRRGGLKAWTDHILTAQAAIRAYREVRG